jgi:hypothetical protein
MEQEIWKAIPNFENYEVSNFGKVRNLNFGNKQYTRELKLSLRPDKRLQITLGNQGKCKRFLVHRLVAEVFLGLVPNGKEVEVDHINNDPSDNRLVNLQLLSSRENIVKYHKSIKDLPIGVYKRKNLKKFTSRIWDGKKVKHLGYFLTPEEASNAYQIELQKINDNV